ncbi:MAG: hypothetical protein LBD66_01660, partial [Holosporales bacterium]|nr:hypothetical protein [Holosporales bacterium]
MFTRLLPWLGSFVSYCPDTRRYVRYADAILIDPSWLHPGTRCISGDMPGFPLLIALCQSLFREEGWQGGLWLVHLFFLGGSAYSLHILVKELSFKPWVRRLFVFSYATGLPLYYTQLIIKDSVFHSLSVLSLSLSGLIFLHKRLSHLHGILLFVTLTMLGFWSEAGLPFLLSLAPLWSILGIEKRWDLFAKTAGLCLMAIFITQGTIRTWNLYRAGSPFMTQNQESVLPNQLAEMEARCSGIIEDTCLKDYKQMVYDSIKRGAPRGNRAALEKMKEENIGYATIERLIYLDFVKLWFLHPIKSLRFFFLHERSFGLCAYLSLWPPCGITNFAYKEAMKKGITPLPKDYHPRWFSLFSMISSGLLFLLVVLRMGALFRKRLNPRKSSSVLSGLKREHALLYTALFLQCAIFIGVYLIVAATDLEYRYIVASLTFLGLLGWWTISDGCAFLQEKKATSLS